MQLEDIFADSLSQLGEDVPAEDSDLVSYGPIIVSIAQKEGKANTLLADQLFSPGLLLAERIERGLVPLAGLTMIELGAGCALPSLLASMLSQPPSLVTITDYPDPTIIDNLRRNVERNSHVVSPGCIVKCIGYEWGQDVQSLLEALPPTKQPRGYDVVILSDLLHFDKSHTVLLESLTQLLVKSPLARAYVAAGKYTPTHVCDHFLRLGEQAGLDWDEGEEEAEWLGPLKVGGYGLDKVSLGVRKGMCRWWVGRWTGHVATTS
ncbi:hypothetical protein JAAARDRAFT_176816 [Jaapia argillacea MUCL 33604]|uniref:Uncharacterized protein n=1 Tax=Jaapia argillacea MUCL 33604 TaxID=933084 RepID=A0A067PXX1_9AGAM|nr:hypothetical protein JAAARDRAFT_176816 [Jaapia argillacea MUCL 33604]